MSDKQRCYVHRLSGNESVKLHAAVLAVIGDGIDKPQSLRTVSAKTGIPRESIRRAVITHQNGTPRPEHKSMLLTREEESRLVQYCIDRNGLGLGVSEHTISRLATEIAALRGRKPTVCAVARAEQCLMCLCSAVRSVCHVHSRARRVHSLACRMRWLSGRVATHTRTSRYDVLALLFSPR